jgi:hypothetical protein
MTAHQLDARRCHRCGRILFPMRNGEMPPHKKPSPPRSPKWGHQNNAHAELTGRDHPWCEVWVNNR